MYYVRNNVNAYVYFEYLQFRTVLSLKKNVEFKGLPNWKLSLVTVKNSVTWRGKQIGVGVILKGH